MSTWVTEHRVYNLVEILCELSTLHDVPIAFAVENMQVNILPNSNPFELYKEVRKKHDDLYGGAVQSPA